MHQHVITVLKISHLTQNQNFTDKHSKKLYLQCDKKQSCNCWPNYSSLSQNRQRGLAVCMHGGRLKRLFHACLPRVAILSQVAPLSTLIRRITLATATRAQTSPRMSIMMPTTTQPAWLLVTIAIPLKNPLKAVTTN